MHFIKVNRIPFLRGHISTSTSNIKQPPPDLPPDHASECPAIYLGKIKNGLLIDKPVPLPITSENHPELSYPYIPGNLTSTGSFVPFTQAAGDEPIISIHDYAGNQYDLYIDTGAAADLIPKHLLNSSFPNWKKCRIPSNTKLLAANDSIIPHEGKTKISIPLPGPLNRNEIQITPFIVAEQMEATTMIIGYNTLKANGLIPIPGSGLLCTRQCLGKSSGPALITPVNAYKAIDAKYPVWTASPNETTLIRPYKRTKINLIPKKVSPDAINRRNGTSVLVRECKCILTTECEECARSLSRVQMCSLINGQIEFTVDNTHSSISYTLTPKDIFYISFEQIFSMKEIAKTALTQIPSCEFEIDMPINPYGEQECQELFQQTREEVTASLKAIIAEPETYSVEGIRPATLRLIDCNGMPIPQRPDKNDNEGEIPIERFNQINPCESCNLKGAKFCDLESTTCELRRYLRHKVLPQESDSTITHHEVPFSPALLGSAPSLIVGCSRQINNHKSTWLNWFKNNETKFKQHHIILQHLNDAVITEVSKTNLLEIARAATEKAIKDIHFTNYNAYGTSNKLLLRCIPNNLNLHIYDSTDTMVAGPAHDPRKKGAKPATPPVLAYNPPKIPPESTILTEPGLPKPITAVQTSKDDTVTILTDDADLRKRCQDMLEAHSEVFATSPSDCGQFKDPITKAPFLFQVRLKGLPPPKQKTRFVSPAKEEAATQLVSAMLANGIVKRRFSNYNSQSVYVAKRRKILSLEEHIKRGHDPSTFVEGTPDPQAPLQLRHCLDLTEVNKNVVEDNMGTLSPKQLLSRLSGTYSAASLDLAHAYHCLTLSPSTELITGWETGIPSLPSRLVYSRATMGLSCSAKWLEIALTKTLSKATNKYIRYADDVLVIGKSDEEVLSNLSCVLDLLIQHGWKIKKGKLTIFAKELIIFGLKADLRNQRISVPRADLDAVLMRARPSSAPEMKSFCGSVAWFGENLGNHAKSTGVLHRMTRKDATFSWNEETLQAYEELQEFMSKPAMHISLPNYDLPFHLLSDSSEHATGCLLLQLADPNDLRIISYKSHIHDLRTSRLSPHERESYAMIYCVTSFYDIISNRPCTIYSDSQASVLLTMMSKTNSKVSRWICLLRSIPFLTISWISSKTPILRLCDYLSRRPATSKDWKNKQPTNQDLERISLAAAKLKRDTYMTLAHHDILMEYVCSLPSESLEQIYDESIYIDHNGNVRISDTDKPPIQHTQCSMENPTKDAGLPTSLAQIQHPAFGNKRADPLGSELPEESDGSIQSKPHQVQYPNTEFELVQHTECDDPLSGRIQSTDTYTSVMPPEDTDHTGRPPIAEGGRPTNNGKTTNTRCAYDEEVIVPAATSVYRIKAAQIKNNMGDPLIYPHNLLSMEEADDLGLLDPATQCKEGPKMVGATWDQPEEPAENDHVGNFLSMCFAKSPFMRLSTLIASQDNDPKLKELKLKCKKAPYTKGEATYLLKQGVLLRLHTKDRLENLQICLSRPSGYMLCLKAHLGNGKGSWRHSKDLPLHHGAKKMHNLIGARFHFDNMYALCKQIVDTCFICTEGKHNLATTRADAHKRVITATVPAEMWSLDLLELPGANSTNGKLLTGLDLFSNFGIAICIDQAPTSEYLYNLILWNIFAAYGRPRCLILDNASYWSSQALKEVMIQMNCELRTIPAYSAKSSPVEALNKLIIKHLRLLHMHYNVPHSQWRSTLPHIMNAINFCPYSGPMGEIHKLSPARVFFGDTRQSLDPSARFDFPFLEHRFKSHADFVRRAANANWAIQQLVAEHKEALQNQRLKTNMETNQRFDSMKTYRLGDVILFDRKLPPGVASKLRPRATYRFVVVGETASSVFVRPWSSGSIDRWSSAQKFTKQSKDAVTLLPLIKLPKERTRIDKSLHLYSANSRAPERHLLKGMAHNDPERFEVEIEELNSPDWLTNQDDSDFPGETMTDAPETRPDPEDFPIMPPVTNEEPLHSLPDHINTTTTNSTHPHDSVASKPRNPPKSILRQNLRRSKRLLKSCTFSGKVTCDDGSESLLHTGPSTPFRIFKFQSTNDNPMEDLDRFFTGEFQNTPTGLVNIQYQNTYNRKCACSDCKRQLPKCRTSPCIRCVAIPSPIQ